MRRDKRKMSSPNVYPLMYPAVCLADEVPRVLKELVLELVEEEVAADGNLCLAELPLRRLEVKLDVELLQEGSNGILVLVLLHLNDLHDLANGVAHARRHLATGHRRCFPRKDGSSGEVSENPWRRCLDGVEICRREEGLEQEGSPLWVVEVDE